MKLKITLLAITMLIAPKIMAQNESVEKSIWGVQIGTFGIWAHNESRLSNTITLRTELGFDAGFSIYDDSSDNTYIMAPVLTLEPRWYYNIKKRNNKGKKTLNNSANFIALKTSYRPDWFTISNEDNASIPNQISIVPYWAIKRNLGKHFTYETGFGIGYYWDLDSPNRFSGITAELHLRIGYTF